MLAVTGFRTTIVRQLSLFVSDSVVRIEADLSKLDCEFRVPLADRYVLAAGVLHQRQLHHQTPRELTESIAVNMVNVVRLCEHILETNTHARICVVGSESGFSGSYDMTYALAKAGVHKYVEWRKLGEFQQLVAVAPPVIADSGMTLRRKDYPDVLDTRRTVRASDVAIVVKNLLYGPPISNTVIRL